MRLKTLIAAAALLAAPLAATSANAAPGSAPATLLPAIDAVSHVDTVQYVYGGRRHCWYPNGWRGPGWYWCGYANRRGYGWGGGPGWNGWTYGGPVVVRPPAYGYYGPPRGYPRYRRPYPY